MIENGSLNPELIVKFQINLMKTQIELEDVFAEIASDFNPNDPVVILCDRGVMDGAAYSSGPMWQALLDETGCSNSQLRDKRYDLVLHLVTAADGAEEFYTKANNEARFEDVKEAVKSDKRTQLAWVGHPYFRYKIY